MNNCHLWILKIYQVDIRNIHYPWYIDGIRKIYAKIYAIVYYVFCTVVDKGPSGGVNDSVNEGPCDGVDERPSDGVDEGPSDGPSDGEEIILLYLYLTGSTKILKYI